MNGLTETLDFLSWPTEAVNAVRGALHDLNVPLPAVLAQLLALGIFFGLSYFFIERQRAAAAGDRLSRLINGIGAGAAAIAGIAIIVSWIDNGLVPRSQQIVGHIDAPGASSFSIDLLDFRGESLAPTVETDHVGSFVITYSPDFADPPNAVLVRAPGCGDKRIQLRRAQLLGLRLSIALDCGDNSG